MFGIIKFIFGTAVLAAIGYFVFFVNIGQMTLYQHLRGITETEEARKLGDSIVEETEELTEQIKSSKEEDSRQSHASPKTKKQDDIDEEELKSDSTTKKGEYDEIAEIISRNKDKVVIVNSDTLSGEDKEALERLIKDK